MSTDAATSAPDEASGVNYLELTFALMAGPLAWLVRLVANSSLMVLSCRLGSSWPLWSVTTACTAVSAVALWSSRRFQRNPGGTGDLDAARWLGLLGVMFNVLALAGILLESAPIAILDVCLRVPQG